MVTKERLKELIQQKATIYSTHWEEEIDLSLPCEIVESEYDNKTITRLVVFEDEEHAPSYMLDNLTEDVEGAKWKYKMHTERTETFEPPTYEQWLNKEIFEFYSKDHKNYTISVCIEFDFFESPAKDYIEITNVNDFDHNKLFCAEKTKENYIKACEFARNLFLGKENANETNSDK